MQTLSTAGLAVTSNTPCNLLFTSRTPWKVVHHDYLQSPSAMPMYLILPITCSSTTTNQTLPNNQLRAPRHACEFPNNHGIFELSVQKLYTEVAYLLEH